MRRRGDGNPLITTRSIILVFLAAAAAALGGCDLKTQPVAANDELAAAPLGTISIHQLAGRLDLSVAQSTPRSATLRDPANCVMVFPGLNGGVYVNGRSVAASDRIVAVGRILFVPEQLAATVSAALASLPTPRPVTPVGPEPRPRPALPALDGTVLIDPGHGGRDPGAISAAGLREKDVNLSVALKLSERLRQRGAKVVLTRSDDRFIRLERRAAMADEVDAALLVSVHADACDHPHVHGYTIYIARAASSASRRAADRLRRRLAAAGIASRGVRKADFRVLVATARPSVLVEMGYLTNPAEAKRLGNASHQDRLAEAISQAIADFLAEGD